MYLLNMVFPAILVYDVFNIVLENFQARDKTKPMSKRHAYQAASKDNRI